MQDRKVYLDKHTNLLQLEEHMYPLADVKEPNVFRNLFHYDEIPKIAFNDRIVPHSMPDEIWITDTTFRDGQQSTGALQHESRSWTSTTICTGWAGPNGQDPPVRVLPVQQKGPGRRVPVHGEGLSSFRRSRAGSAPARRILSW